MVVDDEEFCLSTLKFILFNLGIDTDKQVDFCITGLEAVDQLKMAYEQKVYYKLIFTDFSMPIMNGIEATIQMRAHMNNELKIPKSQQPIIIGVTGHVLEKYKKDGIDAGMDQVYSKPLYAEKMKEILINYNIL